MRLSYGMIRKTVQRFSEKMMPNQEPSAVTIRPDLIAP
jgi:hypothetical protein